MTNGTAVSGHEVLQQLLGTVEVARVAIVDDAFDVFEGQGLSEREKVDLWSHTEFNDDAKAELSQFAPEVTGPEDFTSSLIGQFLEKSNDCPKFNEIWDQSTAGLRLDEEFTPIKNLTGFLRGAIELEVRELQSDFETDTLLEFEPQIIFWDWHLGQEQNETAEDATIQSETPRPVQESIEKILDVLGVWNEKPRPLIVLMSSKPGLRDRAPEFCRKSGILRGMFQVMPKRVMRNTFDLQMHLHLFAESLTSGRRVQEFMDALRNNIDCVSARFLESISDLSLTDYAYIQSLSLQNDGHPLGDYLTWLFSAYFGQMLFADSLERERGRLDELMFARALASVELPTDRLTDVYHSALFDTSVGSIDVHPQGTDDPDSSIPILGLGDVFERRSVDADSDEGESESKPDVLMIINAQCDLVFSPISDSRSSNLRNSILLLPGHLKSISKQISDRSKPKTELYRHDNGINYRIEWDPKTVRAVTLSDFSESMGEEYCRVARLRMPYALEVQRAFTSNLTRVGMPVMPPIYQNVAVKVLKNGLNDPKLEATRELRAEETAFLLLTKDPEDANKIVRQCVLTLPLIRFIRQLLEERLAEMLNALQENNGNSENSSNQIEALKRALNNHTNWMSLTSPFDLPSTNRRKQFISNKVQVMIGKNVGDEPGGGAIATVSIELDESSLQEDVN